MRGQSLQFACTNSQSDEQTAEFHQYVPTCTKHDTVDANKIGFIIH